MHSFQSLYIVLTLVVLLSLDASGQENIPLGEWRIHVSYNSIKSVSAGNQKVFGASSNGIIVLDKSDKSFVTYNKLNHLTNTGIRKINYDDPSENLFVAYDNGTFDVVNGQDSRNFDPAKNTVLTGPREIHDITIQNQLTYLSTDYGVLIFDLQRSEIKETWRDLGAGGSALRIFGLTFYNDSIFLATEKGILAGDPDDNLLDFNNWKRMNSGELSGKVDFIATFNNKLHAAINNSGVFVYENFSWSKQDFLQAVNFTSFRFSNDALMITENDHAWKLDPSGVLTQLGDNLISQPLDVIQDDNGKLWIGDNFNGLVTDNFGSFESILPNGPGSEKSFSLTYNNSRMYLVPGGYSSGNALMNPGNVSWFENGVWNSSAEPGLDFTAVAFSPAGDIFVSSFGYGVLNKNTEQFYDESNSTLININPPGRSVNVTDLHYSASGLWAANYGTYTSLHLLNKENAWEPFSFPYAQARYPLKLVADFEENIWMILNPSAGGGLLVFNKNANEFELLTEADENGELPSNAVYSIAIDRDGYVWAGTDAGVAYFYAKESDAVKPIFENRFLLRDDKVTAIAVDGGNRKWMGTERGVWLFNPTGEAAILNFTESNSPLLSDEILDIEIDAISGEVFFATDRGLVSFRGDATQSSSAFQTVKIFPNPVVDNFNGDVGISGLATDAVVKITDVSGRLIYQTTAHGGTASWNVRDHYGRRVPTGVFLVFAINSDGSESVVGKIAVVN